MAQVLESRRRRSCNNPTAQVLEVLVVLCVWNSDVCDFSFDLCDCGCSDLCVWNVGLCDWSSDVCVLIFDLCDCLFSDLCDWSVDLCD